MDAQLAPATPQTIATAAWHSLSEGEALAALSVEDARGLSAAEAQARLQRFGSNELQEAPRPTFWARLLAQFKNFLIIILIVASVISLLLGDYAEAIAIMAIVLLNTILGVIQESRAEEALAALKKMTAPEAQVLRDESRRQIPARDLVPGDIVFLETGNYVPADVRLLEAVNLKIEEASLTGESEPVQKNANVTLAENASLGDRKNSAYSSTIVTYGRGRGLVVATGMQTQIGKIAEMIQSFETEPTPLQRKLDGLGRTLGVAALAVCALVFVIGMGRYLLNPEPGVTLVEKALEFFIVAISLAIAAVPEGLPAVVTICLALGMQRMVQRHALLRRLPAVEALGSATAICSDKTGTLTQNAMTVVEVYADDTLLSVMGEGYAPEGEFREGEDEAEQAVDATEYPGINLLLRGGVLCNDAKLELDKTAPAPEEADGKAHWRMVGDPTEGALVVAAAKAGFWRDEVERDLPRVAEIPFDSDRKRMTTIHDLRESRFSSERARRQELLGDHSHLAIVKGAPDLVLGLCTRIYRDGRIMPLTESDRHRIAEINAGLASNALRVLAAAVRPLGEVPEGDDLTAEKVEQDLIFVGLWGMIDPARPEVKPAIALARHAGIRTVMITGDYPNTAEAIAREINLLRPGGKVLTGHDLDALDDAALDQVIDTVDVYARVSPQHKVRIVDAMKARRQHRRHDRRRRQRCAGAQARRHRRGDGHHRHRRDQRDGGHGADRRQLRLHRRRDRRRPGDLRQHPEVRLLSAVGQCRRNSDHPGGDPARLAAAADRHPTAGAESGHRWRARAGPGPGKGRTRHHESPAAPPRRAGDHSHHAVAHPDSGRRGHRRRAGCVPHRHGAVSGQHPSCPDDGVHDPGNFRIAASVFSAFRALLPAPDRHLHQ